MEMFALYSEPTVADHDEIVQGFLCSVYGWMCAGLAVTALTAWVVSSSVVDLRFFLPLVAAQFFFVSVLDRRVNTLGAGAAGVLFVLYAITVGLMLAPIFAKISAGHLERTCLITAGSFAVLAYYGTVTRRDLSELGPLVFMGLCGLIFAGLVQLVWPTGALQFMIDVFGTIFFAELTGFDAQRLRNLALGNDDQPPALAVNGALALYLDFLNLFIYLLSLLPDDLDFGA